MIIKFIGFMGIFFACITYVVLMIWGGLKLVDFCVANIRSQFLGLTALCFGIAILASPALFLLFLSTINCK